LLDKGEENDWFASTFIRVFGFLFIAGMAGLIWWQWRPKNPIMNLRLFKYKNFAICCFLMILVGGVLNAATVLNGGPLQKISSISSHSRTSSRGAIAKAIDAPAESEKKFRSFAKESIVLGLADSEASDSTLGNLFAQWGNGLIQANGCRTAKDQGPDSRVRSLSSRARACYKQVIGHLFRRTSEA
jgi:hypothetical protein